jgi:hypothetical protein
MSIDAWRHVRDDVRHTSPNSAGLNLVGGLRRLCEVLLVHNPVGDPDGSSDILTKSGMI